jgi:hypothetical protein
LHVVRQVASTNDCSPTAVLLLLLRIVNHWQVEGASIMYFTSGTAARDLLPGGDGFRFGSMRFLSLELPMLLQAAAAWSKSQCSLKSMPRSTSIGSAFL